MNSEKTRSEVQDSLYTYIAILVSFMALLFASDAWQEYSAGAGGAWLGWVQKTLIGLVLLTLVRVTLLVRDKFQARAQASPFEPEGATNSTFNKAAMVSWATTFMFLTQFDNIFNGLIDQVTFKFAQSSTLAFMLTVFSIVFFTLSIQDRLAANGQET